MIDIKSFVDEKPIDEVIEATHDYIGKANHYLTIAYQVLLRLEVNWRYKEKPEYKKSTFDAFLYNEFRIKRREFDDQCKALFEYKTEVEEHGLGFTVDVIKKARNKATADTVFTKLSTDQQKRSTPLTLQQKQERVAKWTEPKPVNTCSSRVTIQPTQKEIVQVIDWESKYNKLYHENQCLKMELQEKEEQIGKMQSTITDLKRQLGVIPPGKDTSEAVYLNL